jgi:PAS domain S-box-containing protein
VSADATAVSPALSPSVAAAPAHDAAELAKSFAAFTRISKALEEAYERLREQAERVDHALAATNQRLAEKVAELDATTSHLDAVLASLKTAVVVTGLDGRITLTNRAFAELSGRDPSSLLGAAKRELRDGEGRPLCETDAGASPAAELALPNRVVAAGGERRVVRSSKAPVVARDGRSLGEVEVLVDETEVDALREQLRRRETLTALGEMAAGIAHELRNPLTAIEGFADLLTRALPEGATVCESHARRIRHGVRKADAIIRNLLCFARPERFRPRRSRLATLFTELRAAYGEKTASLAAVDVRMPEPAGLTVSCDLALIERVLVNLIENARREAGGDGHVVVTARAEQDGSRSEIVLNVEDDGPGLSPELERKLFRPFVTDRADGTGLGLFLVHRIVELHRGHVAASARAGGGTTFTVRLPDSKTDERATAREHHEGPSA